MKNWKTSLFGLLAALPVILHAMGVQIPQDVAYGISAASAALTGLSAKDSDVTGGTRPQ